MEGISSRTRQRRVVNYRQFEDSDDDSEDDFACRPPAKKAREEKKTPTTNSKSKEPQPPKSSAPTNTATANGSAPKERLSRDEKQLNRDLQQALDASLRQPQSQSSEGGTDTPKREAKSEKENDGDFCLEGEEAENSDSDFSDGGDSDFDASPQPKKGKGKTQKNEQAKTKKTNSKERGASTKSVGSRGIGKKTHPTPSLPARAPATPTSITRGVEATRKPSLPGNQKTPALGARRMPKWTPPARVSPGGENTNFMRTKASNISSSSGSPAIRVGLSRNARVKPLHGGVSISNT